LNALQDKKECKGLTKKEEQEIPTLVAGIPEGVLHDWYERREKNFKVNVQLIHGAKSDLFTYLLLGRDDASPYSRSHQEAVSEIRQGGISVTEIAKNENRSVTEPASSVTRKTSPYGGNFSLVNPIN
jgi:hypothetical protein